MSLSYTTCNINTHYLDEATLKDVTHLMKNLV